LAVILSSAYLHDIGILEAEKVAANPPPELHEKTGPGVAKSILLKLGAQEALIEEVSDIISHHHHPGDSESINFKIVYDADLLENTDEKLKDKPMESAQLKDFIEKSFLTQSGRQIAKEVLLR
jgi:HD superfamily phosphodiesterase